jgi:hypothetical protein
MRKTLRQQRLDKSAMGYRQAKRALRQKHRRQIEARSRNACDSRRTVVWLSLIHI